MQLINLEFFDPSEGLYRRLTAQDHQASDEESFEDKKLKKRSRVFELGSRKYRREVLDAWDELEDNDSSEDSDKPIYRYSGEESSSSSDSSVIISDDRRHNQTSHNGSINNDNRNLSDSSYSSDYSDSNDSNDSSSNSDVLALLDSGTEDNIVPQIVDLDQPENKETITEWERFVKQFFFNFNFFS